MHKNSTLSLCNLKKSNKYYLHIKKFSHFQPILRKQPSLPSDPIFFSVNNLLYLLLYSVIHLMALKPIYFLVNNYKHFINQYQDFLTISPVKQVHNTNSLKNHKKIEQKVPFLCPNFFSITQDYIILDSIAQHLIVNQTCPKLHE